LPPFQVGKVLSSLKSVWGPNFCHPTPFLFTKQHRPGSHGVDQRFFPGASLPCSLGFGFPQLLHNLVWWETKFLLAGVVFLCSAFFLHKVLPSVEPCLNPPGPTISFFLVFFWGLPSFWPCTPTLLSPGTPPPVYVFFIVVKFFLWTRLGGTIPPKVFLLKNNSPGASIGGFSGPTFLVFSWVSR